jgi:hypothetical protein
MKAKPGFSLRTICDTHAIVAEGIENIDFNKIISLNESAAYLWRRVGEQNFSYNDLALYLQEEYEVEHQRALEDAEKIAKEWIKAGIVNE